MPWIWAHESKKYEVNTCIAETLGPLAGVQTTLQSFWQIFELVRMYIFKGKSRFSIQIIFYLYFAIAMANAIAATQEFTTIANAFWIQYFIFLIAYTASMIFINDKEYSMMPFKFKDRGLILSLKTLAVILNFVSLIGIYYIDFGFKNEGIVSFVRFAAILSINIIFSQEIKRLFLGPTARD
ncbi:MAG: hypothetical protein K0M60_10765 [Hydrogenophaga sp.]|nr:hypothetical protein [Hydrogenophaga sp.]